MNNINEIKVPALNENVDKIVDFVNGILESRNCSIKIQTQIDVAIDELFSNISNYAYADSTGDVTVKVYFDDNGESECICNVEFIDEGIPFNPLEKDDPDVTLSADERGIGGLGIFLVKKSMDDVVYQYKDSKNVLIIKKKL